jgi:hypothetical protein
MCRIAPEGKQPSGVNTTKSLRGSGKEMAKKENNKKPNLVTVDDLEKELTEIELTEIEIRVPYIGLFLSQSYRKMFELVEREEPTVSNYHRLYTYCLENSQSYMFLNCYNLTHGLRTQEDFSFDTELKYYQDEKKKLDDLFQEFAGKTERQDNKLEKILNYLETLCLEKEKTVDDQPLMQFLKSEYRTAYTAVKIGIARGIIEFTDDNKFDFKCNRGCVGLFFNEAGCTAYKQIYPHILINGTKPAENTLKNCTKNTPPREWERIRRLIFSNNPETTPK